MEFLVGDIDREGVEGNGTAKVELARFVGDIDREGVVGKGTAKV